MNNIKTRRKLLDKIAQTTSPVPTDQVAAQTTAAAVLPPPAFQASAIYPGVRSGFNAMSIPIIDQLAGILNVALHYSTSGKINWQTLRNNNFEVDTSGLPSPDQKNLANLSKKVYHLLLNGGTNFQQSLTADQVAQIANQLASSQEVSNLSSVNPSGPIAQKIPGNLKTTIVTILTNLKAANPAQR